MPITWYRMIATFFFAGFAPKAPGTAGTIAALPLYLVLRRLSLPWYLFSVALLAVLGTAAAQKMEDLWGKDPSQVVIDEVVGLLITLVTRPKSWRAILMGTVIFRLFDIIKPAPIGYVDKNVPGGFGIMADDMLAGVFSACIIALAQREKAS
ncbi:MAG TPA: phosphatidylglycerophosphatase A [Deltaproteobacteria bacterium]|nr:phosphatidylglycerophosphatase A [Deltaproteobacteria bacterium]